SLDDRLYCTLCPIIPPDGEMIPRDKFFEFVKTRVRELPERNPQNTSGEIMEIPGSGSPVSAVRIAFGQPDPQGFKYLTVAYAYDDDDDQIFQMQIRTDQLVSRERERALGILKTAGMKIPSSQPSDLRVHGP